MTGPSGGTGGVGPPDTDRAEPSWSDEMDREDRNKTRKKNTSWAQLLGNSLPSSWDKNILEVVLQKDTRGSFNISDEDCARFMRKLGLDPRPGIHVEAIQILPLGRHARFVMFICQSDVDGDRSKLCIIKRSENTGQMTIHIVLTLY